MRKQSGAAGLGSPGSPAGGATGPWSALALGALAFCANIVERISGVTQTVSPSKASLQTSPCLQVCGPYAPPPGSQLLGASRFSELTAASNLLVTQTSSPGRACR